VRAAVLMLGLLAACGPGQPDAPSWPAGTALAVNGLPLSVAEVDEVTAWIATVVPTVTAPEHRRRALTWHLLPRLTADVIYATEHKAALVTATEALADLDSQDTETLTGAWDAIGIETWAALRGAPEGHWVGPLHGIGRYRLARWTERWPGRTPASEQFVIEFCDFPFVPADTTRTSLGGLTRTTQLTIVDPAYDRIVPLAWQSQMVGIPDENALPAPAPAAETPQ